VRIAKELPSHFINRLQTFTHSAIFSLAPEKILQTYLLIPTGEGFYSERALHISVSQEKAFPPCSASGASMLG